MTSLICGIFALTITNVDAMPKPTISLTVETDGNYKQSSGDSKLLRSTGNNAPFHPKQKFALISTSKRGSKKGAFLIVDTFNKKPIFSVSTSEKWFDKYEVSPDEKFLFLATTKLDSSMWLYPDGHISRNKNENPELYSEIAGYTGPQNATQTTIYVIDIEQRRILQTFLSHYEPIKFVSSTKDLLAVDVSGRIYVWNYKTGKKLWEEVLSEDLVSFSQNSLYLICRNSFDSRSGRRFGNELVIRNSETGKVVSRLKNFDNGSVTQLPFAFTLDNKYIATSGLRTYYTSTISVTNPVTGQDEAVYDKVGDNFYIKIWELKSGKLLQTLHRKTKSQLNQFRYEPVKFIANGEQLVVYNYENSGMDIWKWRTGKIVNTAGKHKPRKK